MSDLFCRDCGHFIDDHRHVRSNAWRCRIMIPFFGTRDESHWEQCDCDRAPSEIAKAALRRALPYPQIIGDSE